MLLDAIVNFVPIGTNLSLVAGAGVAIPSNIYDILGSGSGTAPHNIIGNAALFGEDTGVGGVKPQVEVSIGTGLVAVGGSTLNIAFQAAPDSATTHLPGTWQTLVETGPLTAAQLVANAICARFDFPPVFPITLRPRYLRLLFSPSTGGSFSAGTVAFAVVPMVRDDQANRQTPANYTVGALA